MTTEILNSADSVESVAKCTDAKGYYKPFRYDWAFEYYRLQKQMDWLPAEVPLDSDIKDWKFKLNPIKRGLLTHLFRFFTTGDVDVGQAYMDKYIPIFKNEEIRMMLSTFCAMESVHADAYSLLLDSVGMPEVEYQAFKQYSEMAAKHDYISSFDVNNEVDVLKALAVFSAFTEGLQLFSTFAILMNFARGDLPGGAVMKGMNQIVTWSIRDESIHVEGMTKLFRVYVEEHPYLWTEELKAELYEICRTMVTLEDNFIDLAFELGGVDGLTPEEVKQYIRHIADIRLGMIMLEPIYGTREEPVKNPLAHWLDPLLAGVEHANFFETRATEYAKAAFTGNWAGDVWAAVPEDTVLETLEHFVPQEYEGIEDESFEQGEVGV